MTLPVEDQVNNLMAKIPSHKGQMLDSLGQPAKGLKEALRSYEIRLEAVPQDDFNLSLAEHNVALSYSTLSDYDTAMEWYERASTRWHASQHYLDEHPPMMKTRIGLCQVHLRRFQEARSTFEQALDELRVLEPPAYLRMAG